MGVTIARGLIGGVGLLLVVLGVALLGLGEASADRVSALLLVVTGGILVCAVLLERVRYRSLHAERSGAAPGRGGGEADVLERRFRPTDEVFVDPTTEVRMRVWLDAATGERRYVPEA